MPPHCDSLDGPVVTAASRALAAGDVDLVLPYVPADAEAEVTAAFDKTLGVRALGAPARDVADRWFFETVVRRHREGEGAPYTGLKPAGLDVGPVIPLAEHALVTGEGDELAEFLADEVSEEVRHRLAHALELRERAHDVASSRLAVEAALGLQVWSHSLHLAVHAEAHEHTHEHEHEHAHA